LPAIYLGKIFGTRCLLHNNLILKNPVKFFRVLKNYEHNKKEAARATTNITQTPSEAFAEIMKNPQQAIQQLMQQNFN